MTQEEFRRQLLGKASIGLSEASLAKAADFAIKKNVYLWKDPRKAIAVGVELAQFLESGVQSMLDERHRLRSADGQPSPRETINNDLVVEWLQPRVRMIRQELFGTPDPPFSTYEGAVEWLVRLGNEQWHRWQQRHQQKEEEWRKKTGRRGGIILFVDPSEIALDNARDQAKATFHLSYERRNIPYATTRDDLIPTWHAAFFQNLRKHFPEMYSDGVLRGWSIEIYEDSILAKLEQASHEIAEAIGFDKADVVAWILADDKPTIPPIRIHKKFPELKLSEKETLRNCTVVIEIIDPEHLTYNQIMDIYHYIREDFKVTKVKALTVDDQRLRDIAKRLGGVPTKHGTKGVFWKKVRQEWKRETPDTSCLEPDALRRRHERLQEKLSRKRSTSPSRPARRGR